MLDVTDVRSLAEQIVSTLGLSCSPVGVRLLSKKDSAPEDAERLERHRYCQALMKARRGRNVLLDGEGIACPAAAAAFGFRPLPDQLKNGKGLVGFGIVSDEAVGARMFEGMTVLQPGSVRALHLFPLDQAEQVPDIVVVEAGVEQLMWIALAYLHARGGERVRASTAILQATCVDATIIPYVDQRLNYSYGCYGCRDATDIGPDEGVLGFPTSALPAVVEHLQFLSRKAIPNSRQKRAFAAIQKATCPGASPEATQTQSSDVDCAAGTRSDEKEG
ncbi:MAG: DUF169 domain-containing protein [Armatimonadota bacterium]